MWYCTSRRSKACSVGWVLAGLVVVETSGVGSLVTSLASAETRVVPSVSLSQRYDSNVFFGPKEALPSDRKAWDWVTTAGANVEVENKNRLGDSLLSAGVNGNVFANNTDLAFVSTDVFAASDLSGWLSDLVRGVQFRVTDSFQYTPEPPAFLTGGKAVQTSDVFSRGIQAVRADTFTNILSVQGGYSLSRSVGFRTNYSYSIFRVGQIFLTTSPTGTPVAFFDTTQHTVTTGPTFALDGGDVLFFKYEYTSGKSKGEGVTLPYVIHTFTPEYVSKAIPGWTLTINAGAAIVEQAGNRAFFSGKLALATGLDRQTRVQLQVSRSAAPAFFGTGGALISNVAGITVSHGFSKVIRLTVNGNYAYNESTPVKNFTLESITGSASLEYKLTRSVNVILSQEYSRFEYTGVSPFDRHVTMVTINTTWK